MLQLKNVHTYYGASHILQGVTLIVPDDKIIALLGLNGMGKTTTVTSIINLTPACEGSITFNDVELTMLNTHEIARLGIGFVPQGRHIFSSLSVEENLLVAAKDTKQETLKYLEELYGIFPVLRDRRTLKGDCLSGGEQQMLAIARALMRRPKLVLMDEPSEGLAPLMVAAIGDLMGRLRDQGISILLVEQNIGMALSVADYVYILRKGKVVHECVPGELTSGESGITEYLGIG